MLKYCIFKWHNVIHWITFGLHMKYHNYKLWGVNLRLKLFCFLLEWPLITQTLVVRFFLNMVHNQLPWWSHNNYSHSSKSLSMLSVNVDFLCWQILTLILVSPCWMLTFSSVSFTVSIPRILETWQHSDCKIKKKIISWIFSLVDLLDRHFIGHLSPTKITLNTQHIQIIKSKIYSIKSTVYFEILCHMRLALLAAST